MGKLNKSATVLKVEEALDKFTSIYDFGEKQKNVTIVVDDRRMLLLLKNGLFTVVRYENQSLDGIIGSSWSLYAPSAAGLLANAGVLTDEEASEFDAWFQETDRQEREEYELIELKRKAERRGYKLIRTKKQHE